MEERALALSISPIVAPAATACPASTVQSRKYTSCNKRREYAVNPTR